MQVVVVASTNKTPKEMLKDGACFSGMRLGRFDLHAYLKDKGSVVSVAPRSEDQVRARRRGVFGALGVFGRRLRCPLRR